jgi:hypothetical protein
MANTTPKRPDPEKARKRALEQWKDPASRQRIVAGLRKANAIVPPKNAAAIVQAACENGATNSEIARALGIGRKLLNEWREKFPAIAEAYELGRQVEHDLLFGRLFKMAMAGNLVACLFLMKTRHGYRETDVILQKQDPSAVAVKLREALRQMADADGVGTGKTA